MKQKLIRFAGSQVAAQALRKHTGAGGALDLRFGMHLLRNRTIPVGAKLLAFGLGALFTWALLLLEMPLETLMSVFLPVIGFAIDAAIDGLELMILPFIFASLLLPYLAPRPLVDRLRVEQAMALPLR